MNANIVYVVIEQGVLTGLNKGAFSYADKPKDNCLTALTVIFFEGDEMEWSQIWKPTDFSSSVEILYYAKDGDIAKFINAQQSIQRVWTYNLNREVEIINLVYDDSLEGKTYYFTHSDVNLTDDGWNMLLSYDKNDRLNELLTKDEIEIFKKSANKDEYKTLYKSYALEKYSNVQVEFNNEQALVLRDGKPDNFAYYKLVNGDVYLKIGDVYRHSYVFDDNTLIEAYEYEYGSEKFYFEEK